MQALHTRGAVSARFDDPNLVSHAGLVPLLRLASDAGLGELANRMVRLGGSRGANADAKIGSIVAGMAAGADSIDDLDVLRHGALPALFGGIRAPSTLGTFLRHFSIGHVAQVQDMANQVLARLSARTPLLPEIDKLAFLDLDSKITEVYGRDKDGAAFGYTHVRGLSFLAATLCSPVCAPVITGTRLRGGNADTRRAAVSFVRQNLTTARTACGATGRLLVRMDSGFYVGAVITAIVDAEACFSVTAPQRKPIRQAIAALSDTAWKPITYATPVYHAEADTWIRTADIAETAYTAFTNPTENPGHARPGRLLIRRARISTRGEQGELLPAWRYHAVFTNSPFDLATAWAQHDGRAGTIELVFADLNSSALAHFPSGRFAANAAWLTLAALTHNLLRATGCLTSSFHAKARTTTLRRHLIGVAARISRSRRRIVLHLPRDWPWQHAWTGLFTATHPPPTTHTP